jgi:hypothetical protein
MRVRYLTQGTISNIYFDNDGGTGDEVIDDLGDCTGLTISNCHIAGSWASDGLVLRSARVKIVGCEFGANRVNLTGSANRCVVQGNTSTGDLLCQAEESVLSGNILDGGTITVDTDRCVVQGNHLDGGDIDILTGEDDNIIANNSLDGGSITIASSLCDDNVIIGNNLNGGSVVDNGTNTEIAHNHG